MHPTFVILTIAISPGFVLLTRIETPLSLATPTPSLPRKNERDWHDWLDQHELEYKFQNIIRKKARPSARFSPALRTDFLLSWKKIDLIIKHLISNNKYIHVEKNGEERAILQ